MTAAYKWHEFYKAAVLETDWSKMQERLRAAESAIEDRKNEFSPNHGGTPEEQEAISDAVRRLAMLRADADSWMRQREKHEP